MLDGPDTPYLEHGGTWRTFWLAAAACAVLLALDLALPGPGVPPLLSFVAVAVVLGIAAAGCLSARRLWTVRVDGERLAVGRERVLLREIDVDHLRAAGSGVDAGAPVLGGGWSLPRGRTGLPLRLTDGRTALVPTRDPAALHEALAGRVGHTSDGAAGTEGTLGP